MARYQGQEFELKSIRLFAGDWARLQELFPSLEPTYVVRTLVRKAIRRVESKLYSDDPLKIDLELDDDE